MDELVKKEETTPARSNSKSINQALKEFINNTDLEDFEALTGHKIPVVIKAKLNRCELKPYHIVIGWLVGKMMEENGNQDLMNLFMKRALDDGKMSLENQTNIAIGLNMNIPTQDELREASEILVEKVEDINE